METGTPSGALAGRPAVGAVILIHGGGWKDTGPALLPPMTPIAQHFNMLGWDTFNTDYRPEAKSLPDVIRVYDYVRSQVGPRKPICALGSSAGGNLALLLAIARPKLACVMSYAGPTDLTVLNNAKAGDVFQLVHKLSNAVRGDLAAWSPLKQASKIRAKALLAYATNDPLVPLSQATELAARLRGSVLSVLQPGSRIFIHSLVKSSQLDHTYAIQDNLLARVAAAHR
jgi:acetyl esterase/lipase